MIDYYMVSPDATLTLKGQSLGSTPKYHTTKNKNAIFQVYQMKSNEYDEYVANITQSIAAIPLLGFFRCDVLLCYRCD